MRNFPYNDDDMDDVDNFFDDDENDLDAEEAYYEELDRRQEEMFAFDLHQKVMTMALRILERGFFWRFYSADTKLKKLKKTFEALFALIKDQGDDDADL